MVTRRFVPYFAALCLLTPLAHAAPITYYFGGQWTSDNTSVLSAQGIEIPAAVPKNLLGRGFDGSFTFDSAALDIAPSPQIGVYGPVPAFHITTGEYSFDFPTGYAGSVEVANLTNPNLDRFSANVGSLYTTTPSFIRTGIVLILQDSTDSAFSSDALPVTPLQLGAFDYTSFRLSFIWANPDTGEFFNRQTDGPLGYLSLTAPVSTVPEPASATLLLSALALLPLARRRRIPHL